MSLGRGKERDKKVRLRCSKFAIYFATKEQELLNMDKNICNQPRVANVASLFLCVSRKHANINFLQKPKYSVSSVAFGKHPFTVM